MEPKLLKLELSSRCNAACVYCGHSAGGDDMPWDMFVECVDAFPDTTELQLNFYGEPLLSPFFVDAVEYGQSAGKQVTFFTNASLLEGELARRIAATAPREVRFSVDSHIPEVFERMRPPLSFERVSHNIKEFQRIKSPKTRTVIALLRTIENADTVQDSAAYWREIVDVTAVRSEVPLARDCAAGPKVPCTRPYTQCIVRADGRVWLCCRYNSTSDSLMSLGHVSDGVREVWMKSAETYSKRSHDACVGCERRWIPRK
jgi:MoaA/NifB/PqqE/SkfB family radical SAM enzyme